MSKNQIYSKAIMAAFCFAIISLASHCFADLTLYTDSNSFTSDLAALGYNVELLDLESITAGSTFPDPAAIGPISFNGFGPEELIVTDEFATISGQNYLGVLDPDNSNLFLGGFELDLQFSPSHAIGCFIVTGEVPGFTLFDYDIRLDVPGIGSVQLDVDDLQGMVGGTDSVFFIGLIDDMQTFSNAQLRYDPSAEDSLTFNIDDVFAATEVLLGDVNRDGFVNLLDVEPFVVLLSSGEYQIEADINQDGFVNLLDIEPFVLLLSGQ